MQHEAFVKVRAEEVVLGAIIGACVGIAMKSLKPFDNASLRSAKPMRRTSICAGAVPMPSRRWE